VAVVEPGAIATEIWSKGRETVARLSESLPPEAEDRYRDKYDRLVAGIEANDRNGIAPVEVAKVVNHALFDAHPRPRYLVGRDAQIAGYANKLLPDPVMQTLIARLA
jgi:NAD(P)-dependent dehydrogenase (short-subunit alcohol dehydrogenase family)